jgi:hypothetical protein
MGDIASESVPAVRGSGEIQSSELFHPLADELMAIAARIRSATGASREYSPSGEAMVQPMQRPSRNHLALARHAYNLRRKRNAIFGNADLFGEPAWDILLDLFIAQAEGKSVSVSSACIGSAAPATTGLRWLGLLADEGLVVRENDPEDNRRVMVRLTSSGTTAMERFFNEVGGGKN